MAQYTGPSVVLSAIDGAVQYIKKYVPTNSTFAAFPSTGNVLSAELVVSPVTVFATATLDRASIYFDITPTVVPWNAITPISDPGSIISNRVPFNITIPITGSYTLTWPDFYYSGDTIASLKFNDAINTPLVVPAPAPNVETNITWTNNYTAGQVLVLTYTITGTPGDSITVDTMPFKIVLNATGPAPSFVSGPKNIIDDVAGNCPQEVQWTWNELTSYPGIVGMTSGSNYFQPDWIQFSLFSAGIIIPPPTMTVNLRINGTLVWTNASYPFQLVLNPIGSSFGSGVIGYSCNLPREAFSLRRLSYFLTRTRSLVGGNPIGMDMANEVLCNRDPINEAVTVELSQLAEDSYNTNGTAGRVIWAGSVNVSLAGTESIEYPSASPDLWLTNIKPVDNPLNYLDIAVYNQSGNPSSLPYFISFNLFGTVEAC